LKTLTKLSLASLLLSTSLLASNSERMEVTFNSDKDGSVAPRIFIPMYWSENFYSGLGYETINTTKVESESATGVSVKTLSASTREHIWLNIINYQTSNNKGFGYSAGLATEYRKFNNEEFGVLKIDPTVHQTENSVKLDVIATSINAELMYKNLLDIFSFRLGAYANPYTTLSVKQNTQITPLIEKEGTASSSTTQDMSYRISADVYAPIQKNPAIPILKSPV